MDPLFEGHHVVDGIHDKDFSGTVVDGEMNGAGAGYL